MTSTESAETTPKQSLVGLDIARWAGRALGLVLILWSMRLLLSDTRELLGSIQMLYFGIYGLVLWLPYQRLAEKLWKIGYVALVLLSAGFVFLMIVTVMFAYMAAAERGERLGVPGFEGSLIFIALMQVPVVLFQRKPDLID